MNKKIQAVIDAFDEYKLKQKQFNAASYLINQNIPAWKQPKVVATYKAAYQGFQKAQGKLRLLYDKLSRTEVEKLIKIRKGIL